MEHLDTQRHAGIPCVRHADILVHGRNPSIGRGTDISARDIPPRLVRDLAVRARQGVRHDQALLLLLVLRVQVVVHAPDRVPWGARCRPPR